MRHILVILALCSCAKESVSNYTGFEEYIAVFDEGSRANHGPNRPVYVRFRDLGGLDQDVPGLCYAGVVYIDPAHWADLGHTQREILILHELGHCVLGKGHTHGGIMNPYLMNYPDMYWSEHKQSLIADLFGRR